MENTVNDRSPKAAHEKPGDAKAAEKQATAARIEKEHKLEKERELVARMTEADTQLVKTQERTHELEDQQARISPISSENSATSSIQKWENQALNRKRYST